MKRPRLSLQWGLLEYCPVARGATASSSSSALCLVGCQVRARGPSLGFEDATVEGRAGKMEAGLGRERAGTLLAGELENDHRRR